MEKYLQKISELGKIALGKAEAIVQKLPWIVIGDYKISVLLLGAAGLGILIVLLIIILAVTKKKPKEKKSEEVTDLKQEGVAHKVTVEKPPEEVLVAEEKIQDAKQPLEEIKVDKIEEDIPGIETTEVETTAGVKTTEEEIPVESSKETFETPIEIESTSPIEQMMEVVSEDIEVGPEEESQVSVSTEPITPRQFILKVKEEYETKFIKFVERYFPEEIDFKIKPEINDDALTVGRDILDKLEEMERIQDHISFSEEYYRSKSIWYYGTENYNLMEQNIEQALSRFPHSASFLIQKAVAQINKNQLEEAKSLLLQARKKAPSNLKIYLLLGEIFLEYERYSDSLEMYKKVILLDNKNSTAYAYRGYLMSKKGYVSEGERILKKSITMDNTNYLPYYFLGEIYHECESFNKAIAMFKKAKEMGCQLKDVDEKLSLSFAGLGKFNEILDLLHIKYSNNTLLPFEMVALANAFTNLKNIEPAIKLYNQAIESIQDKEKKKDIYRKLIDLYLTQKDYEHSVESLKSFVEIEEDHNVLKNLWLQIADISGRRLKNYDEAKKYYTMTLEREAENLQALYGLATTLFDSKDFEQAAKHYENLLARGATRNKPEIFYRLGYSYFKLKRYPAAVKYLSDAQKLGFIEEDLFIAYGNALMELKKVSEAMDAYQKALKINPYNYQTHNNIGVLLARQGQYDQAIKEFQEALAKSPDDKDTLYNLHRAYKILAESKSQEYLVQYKNVT
ncbi:MAG: tetratricopeptide repeat protein [Spirochaetes bacterium]|nr:tetratricopeptide repeat protein [Spirochaetota bacterium]